MQIDFRARRPSLCTCLSFKVLVLQKNGCLLEKIAKELRDLDGMGTHYRHWADRVRDHAQSVNPGRRKVLDCTQIKHFPITWSVVQDTVIDSLGWSELVVLANDMYTFIGHVMTEACYPRRQTLAGGEEGNGFELWRKLFLVHEGGSTMVHLAGIRGFHNFHQCKDVAHLNAHVGEWLRSRAKYALGMPPEHLKEFVIDVLPEELKLEIARRQATLPTLEDVTNFGQQEASRMNAKRLAQLHAANRQKILGANLEPGTSMVMPEAKNIIDELKSAIVNAINPRGGRAPRKESTPNRSRSPLAGSKDI